MISTHKYIAAFAGLAMAVTAVPALAGDVTIDIGAVQAKGGDLLVSLQTRNQFLKNEGSYGEIIAAPTAGAHAIVLKDVAPGDYSVSVLHDADGNRTMTMNGQMPGEGWAMLNGDTLRGLPTFDQVKFTVPADGTEIRVTMDYPTAR